MPPVPGQPLPELALPDPEGRERSLAACWAEGEALLLLGHRSCKTTRETLPYLEQIHRRRTRGDGPGGAAGRRRHGPRAVRTARADAAGAVRGRPLPAGSSRSGPASCPPVLLLVERGGRVALVSEAFRKPDLEAFAARLGVAGPLLAADDPMPSFKPG